MTRITKEDIQKNIKNVKYFYDDLLTICVITYKISDVKEMKFIGESACMYPQNYCRSTGEKYSFEDAFDRLWLIESIKHFSVVGSN